MAFAPTIPVPSALPPSLAGAALLADRVDGLLTRFCDSHPDEEPELLIRASRAIWNLTAVRKTIYLLVNPGADRRHRRGKPDATMTYIQHRVAELHDWVAEYQRLVRAMKKDPTHFTVTPTPSGTYNIQHIENVPHRNASPNPQPATQNPQPHSSNSSSQSVVTPSGGSSNNSFSLEGTPVSGPALLEGPPVSAPALLEGPPVSAPALLEGPPVSGPALLEGPPVSGPALSPPIQPPRTPSTDPALGFPPSGGIPEISPLVPPSLGGENPSPSPSSSAPSAPPLPPCDKECTPEQPHTPLPAHMTSTPPLRNPLGTALATARETVAIAHEANIPFDRTNFFPTEIDPAAAIADSHSYQQKSNQSENPRPLPNSPEVITYRNRQVTLTGKPMPPNDLPQLPRLATPPNPRKSNQSENPCPLPVPLPNPKVPSRSDFFALINKITKQRPPSTPPPPPSIFDTPGTLSESILHNLKPGLRLPHPHPPRRRPPT